MGRKRVWKRILCGILLFLLTVLLIAAILLSCFMVHSALGRSSSNVIASALKKGNYLSLFYINPANGKAQKVKPCEIKVGEMAVTEEKAEILSEDGLHLAAGLFRQENSHKWVIAVHGYHNNHTRMRAYSERYYQAGYNVLAPDLRGAGGSEGAYIGMGWADRTDLIGWIDWILNEDPDAVIVMHGISMGAAAVMMTSGEELPEAVKVFIEDSGYTSVWDIMASEMKSRYDLPAFPMLHLSRLVAVVQTGVDYGKGSAVVQVSKCTRPMLFIHGEKDDFVPVWMLQVVYDAKPGENKQMVSVPGAGHVQAISKMGEAYWNTVFGFIETYIE